MKPTIILYALEVNDLEWHSGDALFRLMLDECDEIFME